MDFLNDLSGSELVLLATILSFWFSQGLSSNEIDNLGNFFSALGANLTVIAGNTPQPSINDTIIT